MGSKSPQDWDNESYLDANNAQESNRAGGRPRGSRGASDGDGCLGEGGGGDEDDGDGHSKKVVDASTRVSSVNAVDTQSPPTIKNRKRKNRSKKAKGSAQPPKEQSSPPRIPLSDLFPSGDYPKGERQHYTSADVGTPHTTQAELRYDARKDWEDDVFLSDYRKAAEVHRQTRQWAQSTIAPGQTLQSLAEGIEDSVRALLGNAGLKTGDCRKSGMGFPTGLCLNNQVAHYTPNQGQKDVVLQQKDVFTVDFGVHINGWIVDSAFTMAFDPTYDNLLAAVKAATNAGIETAGVDVRISDVSAAIQETMESYEVEIGGRTSPVIPVRNLTGHNIAQYHIHGGKSIPFVKNSDQTKMEEGEVFAIETFGTTGSGYTRDDVGVYGYALHDDTPLKRLLPLTSAKRLQKTIRENFGTLPFCRRYLERLGVQGYLAGLNCLVSNGIVEQYQPLCDIKGSYSAQFEHTFLLRETHKEVFSRGDDY